MIFTPTTISLAAIAIDPQFDLHPYRRDTLDPGFHHSIVNAGILHPPILLPDDGTSYTVICGHRRLTAARTLLQLTTLQCLVLPPSSSKTHILTVLLEDQLLSGELSIIEKAYFIQSALHALTEQEVMDQFFARLGLKANLHTLKWIRSLADLPHDMQRAIDDSSISEKILQDLLRLDSNSQGALVDLFTQLNIGTGKQKRLLGLLRDLALRQGSTVATFLQTDDITTIVNHREMNLPQKANSLLDILQRKCFPLSSQAEKEFKEQVRDLDLPAHCELSHATAFEKDDVTLSIRFADFAEYKEKWPQLKKQLLAGEQKK